MTNKPLITIEQKQLLLDRLIEIAEKARAKGEQLQAVITADNLPRIAELLPRMRAIVKELDADAKELKADLMAPVKAQIDAIDAKVKRAKAALEPIDKALATGLLDLYNTFDVADPVRVTKRVEGVRGSTVTVVEKTVIELDDINKVPLDFILDPPPLSERIDWQRVEAFFDAGNPVRGFRRVTKPSHITTKAKEIVAVTQEPTA